LRGGIERACQKRPISRDDIEGFLDHVESTLIANGRREIPAKELGGMVMEFLRDRDEVAYVRFASVYLSFEAIGDFVETVRDLTDEGSDGTNSV
tara:strand:- start:1024 stop:1305 length:282 start_codon:yes stop_codon:yes gene_type:complete